MKLTKMSPSGLSHEYSFSEGEERKSILMMAEYIGFRTMIRLIHFIKNGEIKHANMVHFWCSMAGVQGYPVECFIKWMEDYYNITLGELDQ